MGSTGTICQEISSVLTGANIENYILYSVGHSDDPMGIRYADDRDLKLQALKSRLSGQYGFVSKHMTRKLLAELDWIKPDIVQIHNLHSHNCNLRMLFDYLKKRNIKVYWTFHDCWAFTGYCTHFVLQGCEKWKQGCTDCPQRKKFSWFMDRSTNLYEKKKTLFNDVDLTIITPSRWMIEQIQQSFLRNKPCRLIPNGIDLSTFQPLASDFREKYGVRESFVILGVAFDWGTRKGLDVFLELAKRLDDRFKIVLVGTDPKIDQLLPSHVISIHRTADKRELASLYSTADVFLNPTREDTFPTVNLEALACGTPVVTFETGGSPEMLTEKCGIVVRKDDVDQLEDVLCRLCEQPRFTAEQCIARAREFEKGRCFQHYLTVYRERNG